MRIIISRLATHYLQREARYLKSHNPNAAAKFVALLRDAKRRISLFPEVGTKELHLPIPGSRTLVAGAYLLDYEILNGEIVIFSIRHGRMKPMPIDNDESDGVYDE